MYQKDEPFMCSKLHTHLHIYFFSSLFESWWVFCSFFHLSCVCVVCVWGYNAFVWIITGEKQCVICSFLYGTHFTPNYLANCRCNYYLQVDGGRVPLLQLLLTAYPIIMYIRVPINCLFVCQFHSPSMDCEDHIIACYKEYSYKQIQNNFLKSVVIIAMTHIMLCKE